MPTPTVITDLSQTAASNYPAGTDSPSVLDDVQRAHAAFIALLRDGKGQTAVKTVASAGTTDIGGENSFCVEITGTTTITSFGTNYNGPRFIRFTGALILTHNATLLNLPGAANITTASGDCLIAVPNSTGNGWNVLSYFRASALPALVGGEIGAATATTATTGDNSTKVATTAFVQTSSYRGMESVDYSLSAGALVLKLNPTGIRFRSATLTSGIPDLVSNSSQITTTISSGSTGGTSSGVQSSIALLAINNAGTMELAWCNISGGINLDETTLINTTAEGGAGAADSSSVIYSTTARTGVAFKVVGIFRSTQTTAGNWAQSPSLFQPVGGQAYTSMQSIGFGQKWQDVSGSRSLGTPYTNNADRVIKVAFTPSTSGISSIAVDGVVVAYAAVVSSLQAEVPPGGTYIVSSAAAIGYWSELR